MRGYSVFILLCCLWAVSVTGNIRRTRAPAKSPLYSDLLKGITPFERLCIGEGWLHFGNVTPLPQILPCRIFKAIPQSGVFKRYR